MFWEREPFVWDDEGGRVSRFVSLGAFGGEAPTSGKKQRVRSICSSFSWNGRVDKLGLYLESSGSTPFQYRSSLQRRRRDRPTLL